MRAFKSSMLLTIFMLLMNAGMIVLGTKMNVKFVTDISLFAFIVWAIIGALLILKKIKP